MSPPADGAASRTSTAPRDAARGENGPVAEGAAQHPRLPLARFGKLVNLSISRLLREAGCTLTREQEVILRELRRDEGASQVELARRVGQDANNLSRTLALLEGRGYVVRVPDGSDRRSVRVAITPAGRALHDQAFEAIQIYWQVLFEGMSRRESRAFMASLNRMTDNLERFLESRKME